MKWAFGPRDRGPFPISTMRHGRQPRGPSLRAAQKLLCRGLAPKANPISVPGRHTRSGGARRGKGGVISRLGCAFLRGDMCRPCARARRSRDRRGCSETIAPSGRVPASTAVSTVTCWPNLGPRPRTGRSGPRRCVRCGYRQRCPSAQVDYRNSISKAELCSAGRRNCRSSKVAAPSDCGHGGGCLHRPCQNGVTVILRRASAADQIDQGQSRAAHRIRRSYGYRFVTPRASCRFARADRSRSCRCHGRAPGAATLGIILVRA